MKNVPEYIIVHHTGGTNANPLADTSHHTFKIVDEYHKSLGWEMIGYHYFIEKDGALKAGRAENYHGAHTIDYNQKSIGICLAGNFDITLPTQEQINTLKTLLTDIRNRYLIPLDKIVPHRKFANKTCYGMKLDDNWARSLAGVLNTKETLLAKIADIKNFIEQTL